MIPGSIATKLLVDVVLMKQLVEMADVSLVHFFTMVKMIVVDNSDEAGGRKFAEFSY